jgi:hypothetical protein
LKEGCPLAFHRETSSGREENLSLGRVAWHGVGKSYSVKQPCHTISFCFPLESFEVSLVGEVEMVSKGVYVIKEIRPPHLQKGMFLPPVHLKKVNGNWVHFDSGKETNWSIAIGRAIDANCL